MTDKLNSMLNNIPIPEGLDESIESGFEKAKIQQSLKKSRRLKIFTAVAASVVIIMSSIIIVGPDKVEAAIKRALQYVPGYNVLIDKEEGSVLALQGPVLYEEGNKFVKIEAASKSGKLFSISVQGNYVSGKGYELLLKDETGNVTSPGHWVIGHGSELWNADYYFETESDSLKYSILLGDLEIPFTLEKATEVEDFLQMGNHDSDKGIDIVAIKKPMEDRLMISLLNRSDDKMLEGYPLGKGLLEGPLFSAHDVDISMYLTDSKGNKIYPTLPSSYKGSMSDIYFDITDEDGLKLVLPYVNIKYPDAKTEKIRLAKPQDGETQSVEKTLLLEKFEITIVDIRREGNELIINLKCTTPEDELLDSMSASISGVSGYSLGPNEDTGYTELRMKADDVGKRFSIYFEQPRTVLLGNWSIELD